MMGSYIVVERKKKREKEIFTLSLSRTKEEENVSYNTLSV